MRSRASTPTNSTISTGFSDSKSEFRTLATAVIPDAYLASIVAGSGTNPRRYQSRRVPRSPILALVGALAIQETGDARSPLLITVLANVLNSLGSVTLAFGVGPFPELSIVGIAVASTASDLVAVYLEIVADYARRTRFGSVIYYRKNWVGRARSLVAERRSVALASSRGDE